MSDIFLSYLSSDRLRAATVASALRDVGWDVWWDRSILPGDSFDDVIEEELAATSCLVVLWTTDSVKSHWVRTEAAEARKRGILVPVMLDAVEIPLAFRRVEAADLTDWQPGEPHEAFDELLTAITGLAGEPTPGVTRPSDGETTHATHTVSTSTSDGDVHEQPSHGDRTPTLRAADDSPAHGRAKRLLAVAGAVAVILIAMTAVISLVSMGNDRGEVATTEVTSTTEFGPTTETPVDTLVPPPPEPSSTALAPGLLCRDVAHAGYGYLPALTYWVREGRPSRMDADANGIPCETVYPPGEIGSVINFDPGVEISPGLMCSDVKRLGHGYPVALAYWVREGAPARMDADANGIPCETVYPAAEIARLLQFDQ
jgi:hypothetical protein